ncbi:bifunctional oligoribonuclease/PAP phosphatase NrnA [Mycoplasmopsis agassizii]|uniref:DHH family phosphoesterase n=1 Tax=Mycoplasmopsis agassizii TaxID=33922 RepID=UPI003528CFF8
MQVNNHRIIGNSKLILEAINEAKNIAIFHHVRPDGDCLGSQAGLAEIIKENYPSKNVFIIGDNENNFNFLNWKFDDQTKFNFENSLAIVVDVSDPKRIFNAEFFLDKRFTKRARIDHHEVGENELYDYSWNDPDAAAAAELVAQLAIDNNLKINEEAAIKTYLGIMTDSGRYMYSKNRVATQYYGSTLLKTNFDVQYLYENLYKKTFKDLQFSGYVYSNFKKDGKVLHFSVTDEVLKQFSYKPNEAANFNNLLANIDDNHVWVFFVDNQDGTYRVRIRSNGPEIHEVAAQFKGGGHAWASGATLENYEVEKPLLLKALNEKIEDYLNSKK